MQLNFTESEAATECDTFVYTTELAVNYFRAYANPIITVVGVFGNLMALYLFSTQRPWNRFAVYAMALAISDNMVLLSNTFLDDFLGRGVYFLTDGKWMFKLDTISLETCRIMELLGSCFVFTSGSLLVAFSLDRVACLFRPIQCRSNGGIKIAVLVCVCTTAAGVLIGFPQSMLLHLVHSPLSKETDYMSNSTIDVVQDASSIEPNGQKSCTLITSNHTKENTMIQFIFGTIFTYTLPCVFLPINNALIAYYLVRLKRRRHALRNTDLTRRQMHKWSTVSSRSTPQPAFPAQSSCTMTTYMMRAKSTDSCDRREMCRIIALLALSCVYICFNFPVCVTLSIRVSLSANTPRCLRSFYAHLTRLLTSVKDIDCAVNGYIYALYFQFYRNRLMRVLTCNRRNSSKLGIACTACSTIGRSGSHLNKSTGRENGLYCSTAQEHEDVDSVTSS